MDEQERERIEGQKGGASEAYAGAHYYEPTVTAVTDIVVPATRIQWGPVFAGLLVALAVTFLFTSLGVAIGIGARGMGYWVVGFGSLGLFLGSMLAARTAKADVLPAMLHGVIVWTLAMILHVFAFGSVMGAIVATALNRGVAGGAPTIEIISGAAWWFFGGFLIFLAASILGGLAGINPPVHEEHTTTTT
jgi:hypothetical protein